MSNEFKKAFVGGMGGTLGVLSIPVILFGFYLIYTTLLPQVSKLNREEWLEWNDCYAHSMIDAVKEGVTEFDEVQKYRESACGEEPKRWKWQ